MAPTCILSGTLGSCLFFQFFVWMSWLEWLKRPSQKPFRTPFLPSFLVYWCSRLLSVIVFSGERWRALQAAALECHKNDFPNPKITFCQAVSLPVPANPSSRHSPILKMIFPTQKSFLWIPCFKGHCNVASRTQNVLRPQGVYTHTHTAYMRLLCLCPVCCHVPCLCAHVLLWGTWLENCVAEDFRDRCYEVLGVWLLCLLCSVCQFLHCAQTTHVYRMGGRLVVERKRTRPTIQTTIQTSRPTIQTVIQTLEFSNQLSFGSLVTDEKVTTHAVTTILFFWLFFFLCFFPETCIPDHIQRPSDEGDRDLDAQKKLPQYTLSPAH